MGQSGMRPFRPIHTQKLWGDDNVKRLEFCHSFISACDQFRQQANAEFRDHVIWTDESMVMLNMKTNSQTNRTWAFEQPNTLVEIPTFSSRLHIWAGICSAGIIGPYFFDTNVTAASYLELLNGYVWPIVSRMPYGQHMWFQQDGATPHFALEVRSWLDSHFPQRWIGRGSTWSWPPRSPDLTPPDFFLWPYLKDQVRKRCPVNLQELRQVIVEECGKIPIEMCKNACHVVLGRCHRCIENNGYQVL